MCPGPWNENLINKIWIMYFVSKLNGEKRERRPTIHHYHYRWCSINIFLFLVFFDTGPFIIDKWSFIFQFIYFIFLFFSPLKWIAYIENSVFPHSGKWKSRKSQAKTEIIIGEFNRMKNRILKIKWIKFISIFLCFGPIGTKRTERMEPKKLFFKSCITNPI